VKGAGRGAISSIHTVLAFTHSGQNIYWTVWNILN